MVRVHAAEKQANRGVLSLRIAPRTWSVMEDEEMGYGRHGKRRLHGLCVCTMLATIGVRLTVSEALHTTSSIKSHTQTAALRKISCDLMSNPRGLGTYRNIVSQLTFQPDNKCKQL